MGNDAKKKAQERNAAQRQQTVDLTGQLVNSAAGNRPAPVGAATGFRPSPLEDEMAGYSRELMNNSRSANATATADYGRMMGDYRNLYSDVSGRGPTTFNWNDVNYSRPGELNEAFGFLRNSGKGYQEFADTGGYSDKDIQELRARGMSPIRSAYGNTIRELDRSRSLGSGGANYIAARSKVQRELPGQMADAMTTVNAGLADAIRQGKLAGLSGLHGVGGTMGGLSADEASKILQAQMANSTGRLNAQGMTEGSYQNFVGNRRGILGDQNQLYGTTPGMANMFGQQALQGMGQRGQLEANRNNFGLGLIDANLRALGESQDRQGTPWWRTALGVAGTVAPYAAMAFSDKNMKDGITKIDPEKVLKGIKKLDISTWKYRGDDTRHMGPMAQDVKKHLGIGDGKTLHLADIMGVMLMTAKNQAGA